MMQLSRFLFLSFFVKYRRNSYNTVSLPFCFLLPIEIKQNAKIVGKEERTYRVLFSLHQRKFLLNTMEFCLKKPV